MKWSKGYVTDLDYTQGYYREMSPAMLRLACLCASVEANIPEHPTYLELGFGRGQSLNIHAAANDGDFWGVDFNPRQAVEARRMGSASGAQIQISEDSFEAFAARRDTPEFDIIALHGVWSWVSAASRKAILEVIRRKLRLGGIVYISYNCLPGWAPIIPIRELLRQYHKVGSGQMAGSIESIDNAVMMSAELLKVGSAFLRDNPAAAYHLEQLKKKNRNYVAHEYLNDDWHITSFPDIVADLESAKLTYVGPTRLMDRIDSLHLTPEGRNLLRGIAHPIYREAVRDYLVNARFRCDVFVKGPRTLTGSEQITAWGAQPFILTSSADDIPMTVGCAHGEASLPEMLLRPVIQALADNGHAPKRMDDLLRSPRLRNLKPNDLFEALVVLLGAGHVSPAQIPSSGIQSRCIRINQYILQRAWLSTELDIMASPVTGGGITVPHSSQLFLLGLEKGRDDPGKLGLFAWDFLKSVGQKLMRNGEQLESEDDNISEFTKLATEFQNKHLPIMRALEII